MSGNGPSIGNTLESLFVIAGAVDGGVAGAHDALRRVNEVAGAEHDDLIPYDFQVSDHLPHDQREKPEHILGSWGVAYDASQVVDRYFHPATYPDGWRYVSSGDMNGIWSNLLDDKDRLRGCRCLHLIDQSCFLRLHTRFSRRTKYFDGERVPYAQGEVWNTSDELVFETETVTHYLAPTDGSGEEYKAKRQREYDEKQAAEDQVIKQCEVWLDENHPGWRSCKSNWD